MSTLELISLRILPCAILLTVGGLWAYELIARYCVRRYLRKPDYSLRRLLYEAKDKDNRKAEVD